MMKRLGALLSMLGIAASSTAGTATAADREPILVATPDAPVGFGYKISWFAIKCGDSGAVVEALSLQNPRPANWASGIEAAYARDSVGAESLVFVSPPIDGWVMAVGFGLPIPDHRDPKTQGRGKVDPRFDVLFSTLAKRFPDVQFFASYRVVGLSAWARARAGRIERVFAYADGEVYANLGAQTAEEKTLGFLDVSGLSPLAAREAIFRNAEELDAKEGALLAGGMDGKSAQRMALGSRRAPIPGEDDPIDLAGKWSVYPLRLDERKLAPSLGVVGRFVADAPSRPRE